MRVKVTKEDIIRYMKQKNEPVTVAEMAEYFGVNHRSIIRAVGWLEKEGKIKADFKIKKMMTQYGEIQKPVYGTYKYTLNTI
jgi:response regulator of citrate/malate metabolism